MFTFTGDRELVRGAAAGGPAQSGDLMTEIARASARLATEDNDYLIRMGISRALLTDIVYRQRAVPTGRESPTRRCLTQDELLRYNVATHAVSGPSPTP
jgi:hypothetical protein